jgi:hypothetical protein
VVGGWSEQVGRIYTGGGKTDHGVDAAVTHPEEGFMVWVWLWDPLFLKCMDDVLPGWAYLVAAFSIEAL